MVSIEDVAILHTLLTEERNQCGEITAEWAEHFMELEAEDDCTYLSNVEGAGKKDFSIRTNNTALIHGFQVSVKTFTEIEAIIY